MVKKDTKVELLYCDICGAEEGTVSDVGKSHEVSVRDCGICKGHVCEDDAFQLVDRNGLVVGGLVGGYNEPFRKWICREHVK